ncbi:MAG TPA: response regulator [Thermodesulfovibrionales bacterium]|jgi:CheY-like chemotaxis protein|nr:response regulator [Thermodesulfovibrionales bacterium]
MERALIIDDDQLIHYAISKTLKGECGEVKMVTAATDALREISSCCYCLCFFNIGLPGVDSIGLLEKITEISPDTKIIGMTGSHKDTVVEGKAEEHLFHLLEKPFEISELKAVAAQALGNGFGKPFAHERRARRIPSNEAVTYSITTLEYGIPTTLSLRGQLIDISDIGASLKTLYPLEPGQMIVMVLNAKKSPYRTGIVRRSEVIDENRMQRVGIEFLEC